MANKTVRIGAINIVTHPHSPQNYIKLLQKAEKLNRPIHLMGDTFGSLSFVSKEKTDKVDNSIITGEFIKYTDIDFNSEWYNTVSRTSATKEELKKVNELPKNLKPNSSRFSFIFYPDSHIMLFETKYDNKTFSQNFAQKVLISLFESPEIFDKFGKVNVTIIPQVDKVSKILSDKTLSYLNVVIEHKPNPDDVKSAEAKVKKRLARLNAESQKTILTAPKGENLTLDEEEKIIAKVAAKNGFVEAKVTNEDNRVELVSTKSHPFYEPIVYDSKTTDAFSKIKDLGPKIISKISKWISDD